MKGHELFGDLLEVALARALLLLALRAVPGRELALRDPVVAAARACAEINQCVACTQ